MLQHALPEYRRKTNRAPANARGAANKWTLGHARAVKLVASLERAGHQTIYVQLTFIRRTTILTQEQDAAVMQEIEVRRRLIDELTQVIKGAQCRIDSQYLKTGVQVPPEDRIAASVPGPFAGCPASGPSARATVKATAKPPKPHPDLAQLTPVMQQARSSYARYALRNAKGQLLPRSQQPEDVLELLKPSAPVNLTNLWFSA